MTPTVQPVLGVVTLIGFAVSAAVGVGLSFLAALLKPKGNKFTFDNRPTPIAARGRFLPIVLGTRQTTHIFGWAGKRRVDKQGGGGKDLGGSDQPETVTYYENGWHLLCVGRGTKLIEVRRGGKVIWPKKGGGPVTPDDTPSGSLLECRGKSKFEIWWGDRNQDVNGRLGEWLPEGPKSGWPNVMYVLWRPCWLGQAPTWPELVYTYEVAIEDSPLAGSTAMMAGGCNPAHALWRVLTLPFPHGIGLPAAWLDQAAFEALGTTCEEEGLAVNLLADDGQTAAELLQQHLSEVGFFFPQVGELLTPKAIRSEVPTVTLSEDVILDSDPEAEQHHGDLVPDRTVYVIKDAAHQFEDMDVQDDSDAQARQGQRVQVKRVALETITDRALAWSVRSRLRLVEQANAVGYRFKATRDARALVPGTPVIYPSVGQLRIMAVKLTPGRTRQVDVEAILDPYASEPGAYSPGDTGTDFTGAAPGEAAADLIVKAFPVPDDEAIAVGRVRANEQVDGARVHASVDGTTYVDVGSQDSPAAGGSLCGPLLCDQVPVVAVGPTFSEVGPDIGSVVDLSGNDAAWTGGQQVLVIDDEVMFLQRITAVSGGWQLEGIIRAQYGTLPANHAPNAKLVIVQRSSITPLRGAVIASGASLLVKTQPHAGEDVVDLSSVTAVSVEVP